MIKVGFIGAGGIAQFHLNNLKKIDDVRVAAVADVDAERAEKVAAEWDARSYTDWRALYDNEDDLDGIFICVPPFAHEGQERVAVERGIPFLVEKPIDTGTDYAEEIAEAVAAKGLITSVGYHWRYSEGAARALEAIGDREVAMALGYWIGGMPGVFWWRRHDLSGGQFVEQTTHIVDLARYVVGEITEVYAQMATRALTDVPDFSTYDVGTVTVKFANGAVGTISNSCIGASGPVGLHLYLRDETIEISSNQLKITKPGKQEIYSRGKDPYLTEDEVFIEALRTGDGSAILSPYADALKTQRVCDAANRSAKEGRPISLEG